MSSLNHILEDGDLMCTNPECNNKSEGMYCSPECAATEAPVQRVLPDMREYLHTMYNECTEAERPVLVRMIKQWLKDIEDDKHE